MTQGLRDLGNEAVKSKLIKLAGHQDICRAWSVLKKLAGAPSQQGFTLPLVMIMVAISLVAISSVTFLATHFRSIANAEDGERIYYAFDASIEAALADLVRGADLLDASYSPPSVALNDVTPSITIADPGSVATLAPLPQFFDPGVSDPELVKITSSRSYLMHILNVHQGALRVNWAFDITGSLGAEPTGSVTIKLLKGAETKSPGRSIGCPTGDTLVSAEQSFTISGTHNVFSGTIEVTEPGVYSIAFCVNELNQGSLTTMPFQPTGHDDDTWVYGTVYKDYKITSQADGASLTAHVRQMPGPIQPPAGEWSDVNISWITNQVTPYQWAR